MALQIKIFGGILIVLGITEEWWAKKINILANSEHWFLNEWYGLRLTIVILGVILIIFNNWLKNSKNHKDAAIERGNLKTFIVFNADTLELIDSNNISSITDNGTSDISFNFSQLIPNNYEVSVLKKENENAPYQRNKVNYKIINIDNTNKYLRLEFPNGLSGIIRINFYEKTNT